MVRNASCTLLQATLKDLQTTLKIAKTKEAASLPKEAKSTPLPPAAADLESGVAPDEHQALLAQQQQQQQQERSVLESRLQYSDALIDERDEGIQDIQRNIQDIQEMFQVRGSPVRACLIFCYNLRSTHQDSAYVCLWQTDCASCGSRLSCGYCNSFE